MYRIKANKNNIIDNYYYSNLKDVYIVYTNLKKDGYIVTVNKVKK